MPEPPAACAEGKLPAHTPAAHSCYALFAAKPNSSIRHNASAADPDSELPPPGTVLRAPEPRYCHAPRATRPKCAPNRCALHRVHGVHGTRSSERQPPPPISKYRITPARTTPGSLVDVAAPAPHPQTGTPVDTRHPAPLNGRKAHPDLSRSYPNVLPTSGHPGTLSSLQNRPLSPSAPLPCPNPGLGAPLPACYPKSRSRVPGT